MQQNRCTLYYSSDPVLKYRFLKIKTVIQALKITNIVQSPKQLFTNLHELSPISTLPILQDSEHKLNLTSSNSIIRYLAEIADSALYPKDNIFVKSLVDQWLDYQTCQLNTLALAVELFTSGRQVDIDVVIADADKALTALNKGLNKKKYLAGEQITIADLALAVTVAPLITNLFNQIERKKFTHIVNWYLGIAEQSKLIEPKKLSPKANTKVQKWKNKGKKQQDNKKQQKQQKIQKQQKQQKKVKKNKYKKDNKKKEDDPTKDKKEASDDDDKQPAKPHQKPVAVNKKQKKKSGAKSTVFFDVKVYEEGQDLNKLFQKITTTIVIDGLVWNKEPKILPVAYTMNKLQIGCTIEDGKVNIEEIFETIRSWENEIQSVVKLDSKL